MAIFHEHATFAIFYFLGSKPLEDKFVGFDEFMVVEPNFILFSFLMQTSIRLLFGFLMAEILLIKSFLIAFIFLSILFV